MVTTICVSRVTRRDLKQVFDEVLKMGAKTFYSFLSGGLLERLNIELKK